MYKNGICLNTLIPIRSDCSETSEMVSQVLFGELFNIVEQKGNWVKIVTDFDNYTGWIDVKLVNFISEKEKKQIDEEANFCTMKPILFVDSKKNDQIPIVAGSSFYKQGFDMSTYISSAGLMDVEVNSNGAISQFDLSKVSKQFLNAPYLWGGRTILGIDCSGFTQLIYKLKGINLPRDASEQIRVGSNVSFIEEGEEGDLAFFDNEEGKIIHVGILLNSKEIIHASGCVRIDKIDHQGIFNKDIGKYTHKLRMVKRIIK